MIGRPPKPASQRKDRMIRIYIDARQLAALRKCRTVGERDNQTARRVLLEALGVANENGDAKRESVAGESHAVA